MSNTSAHPVIRITESDNVGIIPQMEGLPEGSVLTDGTILREFIPMGHKVALTDLHPGEAVIRYGVPIGYTNTLVPRGTWVHSTNMGLPPAPELDRIPLASHNTSEWQPLTGFTFQGYRNADGTVGTKNVLGITTSVQCVAGMTHFIERKIREELLPKYPNVDGVVALNHTYGCGVAIDAPAAIIPIRTIRNIVQNPNFGGEVMVVGLGCEKLRPERLRGDKDGTGSILYLQDESFHGFSDMVAGIMATAEQHLRKLNKRRRETCPASNLVVGMQCGGSDAFSGLTGNPVVGFAADLIVRAGGTALFSEVTEVRDAVHLLTARAANTHVAQALVDEMRWYDDYLTRNGADRSANPTPGNKRGGLSNVVEKALGSIAKSGTSPIVDVLGPGERVRRKGLQFAATPASDFVCGTLQLAAGMNLHVFITGRGTPYGLAMVPVVKVSSNSKLGNRWHDLIDFDAGPVAFGQKTIPEMGWELFHLLLAVASGEKIVAADKWGLHNELVLFNPGPLT